MSTKLVSVLNRHSQYLAELFTRRSLRYGDWDAGVYHAWRVASYYRFKMVRYTSPLMRLTDLQEPGELIG